MSSLNKKKSIFDIFHNEIEKQYKSSLEKEAVMQLLKKEHEQSLQQKIITIRKIKPLKKILTRWFIKIKYGIHWAKPFYPVRLARNFFLQFIYNTFNLNKYVFRGVEFAITFKCNFKCTHCLCTRIDETHSKKELQIDDYKRIVKEAMNMGATTFGLEGGEPLISRNWQAIIKALKPHYNHIIISTNGYLLNEKKINECAELGVDTINFSLDSGTPEIHDLFRGKKGSYDKVINNMKLCKKYKIKPLINTVVHKGNLYTTGFIRLLEFGETEKVLINVLFAKGVGNFKDIDSMLDSDDFLAYKKITAPYSYVHVHHKGPLNYNYGQSGCPGTKEMFNLTPYGDVMNCANMHIYFGNVFDESLKEIRQKALKNSPFGKYQTCFLTMDNDFMNVYYPLLEKKRHITIEEFNYAFKTYKENHKKIISSNSIQNDFCKNSVYN
ncbi:MAG: radical SAM protein [archaeon]|nr:radical SAM protein [archaeon]